MNRAFFVLVFTLFGLNIFGQYNYQFLIASSGDFYETTNYSVSWSLGEVAIETYVGASNIITQGFQQTLVNPVSINEQEKDSDEIFKLYPNPTSGEIKLIIDQETSPSLIPNIYELFDVTGRKVKMAKIPGFIIDINISGCTEGTYYLKLSNTDSNYSSTLIIQKLN